MSATGATLRGRTAAAALMVDTCTITRGALEQVYDPGSDLYVTPAGAVMYAGSCRVKPAGQGTTVTAGEQTVALWPFIVSVPMTVVDLDVDDVVTVTASLLDPDITGLRLRVRDVAQGSHLTARRMGCEVQT